MSSALWYPFLPPGARPALRFVRGEGSYLCDDHGRRYLNATGGLWNITVGLGNPAVTAPMEDQIRTMAYSPLFYASHNPAEQLAERLVSLAGSRITAAYLSTSGTSAVEVAFRMARVYHSARGAGAKRKIISFDQSYHGCSWMNLSASGLERAELTRWDAVLPDFQTVPSPTCTRCPLGMEKTSCAQACLDQIADLFAASGHEIAAMIVEPVLGSGGIIVPPAGYYERLSRLCREHEILLIADEVATGGGRCGVMFASHLLGLTPDMITLSKGLNSGYFPLGATLVGEGIVNTFRQAGAPLLYGSTQDGSPVACTAALATLNYIEAHGLIERARTRGDWLKDRLAQLSETRIVADVRGLGLMIGIELRHRFPEERPFTEEEAARVRHQCQEEGLLVYHFNGGLSLFPPMTLSDEEAEELVDILQTVLEAGRE